jgi:flagellar basal-body rod protein FlgF
MSGTIYQAAAGALLQQMRLDMLSNNLANVNTTGFKADMPVFHFETEDPQEEIPVYSPGRLSPYAPPMSARTDFSAGPAARTGNPLNLAIAGKGFFEVETPDGPQYTRTGNFAINAEGILSTADGWPIMGQGGTLTIDGTRIAIDDNGEVFVDGESAGTLRLVDFEEPYALDKAGDTRFVARDGAQAQPLEPGTSRVVQGFLEASNVDAIRTMTEIIETMRVFEAYQRIIRTADETTAKTVNEVGGS